MAMGEGWEGSGLWYTGFRWNEIVLYGQSIEIPKNLLI